MNSNSHPEETTNFSPKTQVKPVQYFPVDFEEIDWDNPAEALLLEAFHFVEAEQPGLLYLLPHGKILAQENSKLFRKEIRRRHQAFCSQLSRRFNNGWLIMRKQTALPMRSWEFDGFVVKGNRFYHLDNKQQIVQVIEPVS